MKEILNNKGGTDEEIVEAYLNIANNATKFIATKDDWIVPVPDYNARLAAWKDIAKMKWLFQLKNKVDDKWLENVIYILN